MQMKIKLRSNSQVWYYAHPNPPNPTPRHPKGVEVQNNRRRCTRRQPTTYRLSIQIPPTPKHWPMFFCFFQCERQVQKRFLRHASRIYILAETTSFRLDPLTALLSQSHLCLGQFRHSLHLPGYLPWVP